jgi:hypothetical protein
LAYGSLAISDGKGISEDYVGLEGAGDFARDLMNRAAAIIGDDKIARRVGV